MQGLSLDLDIVKDHLPIKIVKNIYVGSLHAACNKEELLKRSIKYVLNISGERNAQYSKHFTYLSIDLRDKDYSNLLSCIPAANLFIHTAMEKNLGVLVHCRGGRSRSPAVVAAYLMKERGISYLNVLKTLQEKRKVVSINKGFERQLKAYERCDFDVYRAQQRLLKRRVEQMAEARSNRDVSSPRRITLRASREPATIRLTEAGRDGVVNIIPPLRGLDHEFICRRCHTVRGWEGEGVVG